MQAALIAMTILGCDDSISECRYVETASEQWVSVELCDAASERVLGNYANLHYPTVVAVCKPQEKPADVAVAVQQTSKAAEPPAAAPETIAGRAMAAVRDVLPGTKGIRIALETPLHVVSDSYAWVAKKLTRD